MKKVFFTQKGTASLTQTEDSAFFGELHIYQAPFATSFQSEVNDWNYNGGSMSDARQNDRAAAYSASQSAQNKNSTPVSYFENIVPV